MRVLVTGTEGQVARALLERGAAREIEVILVGRPTLDLERPETVGSAIRNVAPDVVVNAAAYTAVDLAESEPERAEVVNGAGAGAVASAARALGVPVIQISTDYVFDGSLDRPYREDDPVGPTSAYGRSKLSGERAVAASTPDYVVLRTAWVYSPFGKNFLKTMLRLAADRETISVVADQHGSPTSAHDIADGVLTVARNMVERPDAQELRGTFHMTGAGYGSWADLAEAVFAAASAVGGQSARVSRIATAAYPTPAKRPLNSRLECRKLAEAHGVRLPDWRGSVEACVARVLDDMAERGGAP